MSEFIINTTVTQPSVTIFFPCYNDEHSIGTLVTDAIATVKKLTSNFEIIVIDDASTDNSKKILALLKEKYSQLRIITHKKNLGYGKALRDGFASAKKDLVFYTDGDGQYDPRELSILLPLMTPDVHVVNGIKMVRKDPTYRIAIGNLYSLVARWIFWLPIQDAYCDFRLLRKNMVRKLDLKSTSGSICIELVKKMERQGAVFRQVSIHHFERRFGQSQFFRPNRLIKTFAEIVLLWWDVMIVNRPKIRSKLIQ
jgi:glycosyltransferase involved in cell wall biosynthesis